MVHAMVDARPQWQPTGHPLFPVAAKVDGVWWVLRRNDFPDHPLWTLFVDGNTDRYDTTTVPTHWEDPFHPTRKALDAITAREALAPVDRFEIYGSEAGQPCDASFCCFWRKPTPAPPR